MKLLMMIVALIAIISANAQEVDSVNTEKTPSFILKGYVKTLPSMNIADNDKSWSNTLNNRLNFSYTKPSWVASFSVRNRMLTSKSISNPMYVSYLEKDGGFIDASWVLFSEGDVAFHTQIDRCNLELRKGTWEATIGRQRINWGVALAFNPNDLFNSYNFFDFDYEERPGSDAIRIKKYTSELSRFEVAIAPKKDLKMSTAAMLYSFNKKSYDFQFISAYYRNRFVLGTAWAGRLGPIGFKGEISHFTDVDSLWSNRNASNTVAVLSFDYIFKNGIYTNLEILYNQPKQSSANFFSLTEPLSADRLFFTKYAVLLMGQKALSPLWSAGLSGMYFPDEEAWFISPNISYSVKKNIDFQLLSQIFTGGKSPILSQAGTSIYAVLKWSF